MYQDASGKQGTRLSAAGPQEIWTRDLTGGRKAIALFNRGAETAKMTAAVPGARVRDVWAGKAAESAGGSYTAEVPAHGVVLLLVSH